MALQGTIDTFDLTEVIRMLAVGEKTGRLGLSGDRGSGSLWFAEGDVVSSETDTAEISTDHAGVLFQLLRFETGSFVFDQGSMSPDPDTGMDAESVIVDALGRLDEWKEISAVVPSLDHRVDLVADLKRSDVVIDKATWRAVASVGGGASVAGIGRTLDQDELDVSRIVKSLVELGLAEVSEPREASEPMHDDVADSEAEARSTSSDMDESLGSADVGEPPAGPFALDAIPGLDDPVVSEDVVEVVDADAMDADLSDPMGWPEDEVDEADSTSGDARDQLDALASGFGLSDEPFVASEPDVVVADDSADEFSDPEPLAGASVDHDGSFPIEEAEAAGEATTPLFAHDAESTQPASIPGPGEAAEVARQLANLSPEAARAVAAAARATTEEEREAALAQVADEGDEPLDSDLLRSFLASVKQ